MIVVFLDRTHLLFYRSVNGIFTSVFIPLLLYCLKVKKKANIRNINNQVLHPTRNTIWESDINAKKHHTIERQEVSPFSAGDHNAARISYYRVIKAKTSNINNKKDPQNQLPTNLIFTKKKCSN